MGETQNGAFQLSFNASLKVDFQGSRLTSNGGLILLREIDERLALGELIEQHLTDSRRGKNTQFPSADLLRQSVYSRLPGFEDLNDAQRLSRDPTFRLIDSEKNWDRGVALTSRLQSFEAEMLAEDENYAGLEHLSRALIGKAEAIGSAYRTVLYLDSTEIPVYGEQEQSAYNGYVESTCYHPLLLFNAEGDCRAAKLRPGNVHSAEGWGEVLLPEIERQQEMGKEVAFRADAAFGKPEVYEALEARGVKCAIRIPDNDSLERGGKWKRLEVLAESPARSPAYKGQPAYEITHGELNIDLSINICDNYYPLHGQLTPLGIQGTHGTFSMDGGSCCRRTQGAAFRAQAPLRQKSASHPWRTLCLLTNVGNDVY